MFGSKAVIIGDLNSRIPELKSFSDPDLYYNINPDRHENSRGREIKQLCKDCQLYPVNNSVTKSCISEGNFTFRMKDKWVSQIDWMLCSREILEQVESFTIKQEELKLSNHAPLSISIRVPVTVSLPQLLYRASLLEEEEYYRNTTSHTKAIQMKSVNTDQFIANKPNLDHHFDGTNVNQMCASVSEMLHKTCNAATSQGNQHHAHNNSDADKWSWILAHCDSKELWRAINWKGELQTDTTNEKPADAQFKEHFESLLLTEDNISIPDTGMYVPILDDEITPVEVQREIDRLKVNKAAGTDGIPPGVLKWLPVQWVFYITLIFNNVFFSGMYPSLWTYAKFFVVFKKGLRTDTNNYRGISIPCALAKLYDSVLNSRLCLWFKPDVEQAGAQKGRGCVEQILALRLFIDIARKKKEKLYVLFVDFDKAYDRVSRSKLLSLLAEQGCGKRMVNAIAASLQITKNIYNSCLFSSTAGVRQGGATSCSLFTLFVNPLIRALKGCDNDGFLQDNHALLLMDDTAILASNRTRMHQKIDILLKYCKDFGMKINAKKTQFIAINVSDTSPFVFGETIINGCEKYNYLGSVITGGSLSQQIKEHSKTKISHLHKFYSFLARNRNAPFDVKKKVWESALSSAIMYGCESWWCEDIKCVESMYMKSLKQMLGVRLQTCNDLCLIECGIQPLKYMVQMRQRNFIEKVKNSGWFQMSPLQYAIETAKGNKTPMGKYLSSLESNGHCGSHSLTNIINKVITSDSSVRKYYREHCNRSLKPHDMYSSLVPELNRIAFTQLRLSSHKLRIETGRWCRTPRNLRLCQCDNLSIQNEEHVVCSCPISCHIRMSFNEIDFSSLHTVMSTNNLIRLAEFSYKLLKCYESDL